MARVDVLRHFRKDRDDYNFDFDSLSVYPLDYYISPEVVQKLNKIARDGMRTKKKYKLYDDILEPIGFKRASSGTNRVCYKFLNDQRVLLKVALDLVGLDDSLREFNNQRYLKPFVCKVFEVSPCGTVGLVEKVQPITALKEFKMLSNDIFDMLTNMLGQYTLDDIGVKCFMNYGIREDFGPVLLDYPYMYEIDPEKIFCREEDDFGFPCGGEIDYDEGFNIIRCSKCGKIYLPIEVANKIEPYKNIKIDYRSNKKGEYKMKVAVVRRSYNDNGEIVKEEKILENSSYDQKESSESENKNTKESKGFSVKIERTNKPKFRPSQKIKTNDSSFKHYEPQVRSAITTKPRTDVLISGDKHTDIVSAEVVDEVKVNESKLTETVSKPAIEQQEVLVARVPKTTKNKKKSDPITVRTDVYSKKENHDFLFNQFDFKIDDDNQLSVNCEEDETDDDYILGEYEENDTGSDEVVYEEELQEIEDSKSNKKYTTNNRVNDSDVKCDSLVEKSISPQRQEELSYENDVIDEFI